MRRIGNPGSRSGNGNLPAGKKINPGSQKRIVRLMQKTALQLKTHVTGKPGDPPVIYRIIGAPANLWDVALAPRLTVIPAGEFTMGSPASEPGRSKAEGPQHRVFIARPLAVGTTPVTRDEYAAFVADTLRPDPVGCFLTYLPDQKSESVGYNWHNPGFAQSGNDPAVCVSWEDARAYAAWLTQKTGERYRLLSEAEWEYASRAGTSGVRPWGDAIGRDNANYGSEECCKPLASGLDRWEYTSPAGSFPPNAFGLYDVLGNVWQRLDDCWSDDFTGAPADGSVWQSGDCKQRTGHGGAFDAAPAFLRLSFRGKVPLEMHYADGGFRVAREL
jgi:formylglycine-generating enzyme required for sulfatase activity